jgi:hypothetical protein
MKTTLKPLFLSRMLSISWHVVLLTLLFSVPVAAQTERGSLTVSVIDTARRPVAGALVTVTAQTSERKRSKVTDARGRVFMDNLEADTYTLEVTHQEIPRAVIPSGILTTTVTVEDRAILVEVQIPLGLQATNEPPPPPQSGRTAGLSGEVTSARREELFQLPNPNNDITPLLDVVPGAIATGSAALGRVSIDGKGKEQQTFRLDGVSSTSQVEVPTGDAAIGAVDTFQQPNVALSKPKVVNMAFEPAQGPGTGSVTNVLTHTGETKETGAKAFKFQLYDVMRNDALNARNFFDGEEKNGLRRNQFGGKVSGPISNRKAFFFLGYEGIRGRTEQNVYEAVPVEALCRCGAGAVSPFLGGFLPAGTFVVPSASQDPNFLVAQRRVRTVSESDAWNIRLDWLPFVDAPAGITGATPLKAQDRFAFRFTRQEADTLLPDGVTGRLQRQRVLFANGMVKADLLSKNYTHVLTFGLNHVRAQAEASIPITPDPALPQSLINVSGTVRATGLGSITAVPVATLGGLIKNVGRGYDLTPRTYTATYNMSRSFDGGNHVINVGGEAWFTRLRFDRLGGLTYNFPNAAALRENAPSTITFLSDLSGVSPFDPTATGPRHATQNYYTVYYQGLWKHPGSVTGSSYAITYGLRYDYFGAPNERADRAVIVNPLSGEFLPRGTPFFATKKNNFQPRVGFEYVSPLKGEVFFTQFIIRAGAGVYSGVPRLGDQLLPIESDRFSTGRVGGTFPLAAADVVRDFVESPATRQYQPLAFAPDFTSPERAYKWNVSFTQTLRRFYDFSLSYNGNVGRNLPLATLANPIIRVETNPDPTRPAIIVREFDDEVDGRVFKPFGEFFYRTSRGRSNFNALIVALERNSTEGTPGPKSLRFDSFSIKYTLSRNRGNVSGVPLSNPTDFDSDYGYNALDARHNFVASASYPLTSLKTGSSASSLIYGWTITPKLTVRSGLPLIVRLDRPDVVYLDASGNVFSSPAAGRRAVINTPGGGADGKGRVPDLIPGISPYLNERLNLLNPAAFAIPAPGSFGNLRRGELRGPSSVVLDFAVTRRIFDREKMKGIDANLKVEFLNVLNRANFNNPTVALPNALGTTATSNQIQPGVPFTATASPGFGVVTAAESGRQIQLSLIFRFNEGFK